MERKLERNTELLIYEMPWYAYYVSNNFLQTILAKHTARKVNRKMKRYEKYYAMKAFILSTLTQEQ